MAESASNVGSKGLKKIIKKLGTFWEKGEKKVLKNKIAEKHQGSWLFSCPSVYCPQIHLAQWHLINILKRTHSSCHSYICLLNKDNASPFDIWRPFAFRCLLLCQLLQIYKIGEFFSISHICTLPSQFCTFVYAMHISLNLRFIPEVCTVWASDFWRTEFQCILCHRWAMWP